MQIEFGSAHMRTLKKLMDMAEKNGCKIVFSFKSSASSDLDYDLVEEIDGKEFSEELSGLSPEEIQTSSSSVCFELIRNEGGGSILSLKYEEKSTFFKLTKEDLDDLEKEGIKTDELNGSCDWNQSYFDYESSPTIVWEQLGKPIKDYRVYRAGMALKYFSDVVCAYFNEPLIEETY